MESAPCSDLSMILMRMLQKSCRGEPPTPSYPTRHTNLRKHPPYSASFNMSQLV